MAQSHYLTELQISAAGERACITRVLIDGAAGSELAAMHQVMRRIREAMPAIQPAEQALVGEALLDFALARLRAGR